MKIITEGHDRTDAVMQIVQLFFDIHSDIEVVSRLYHEGGKCCAKATVILSGKFSEGEAECEDADSRRAISDLVKKSVLTACRFISPICSPWGISTGIRPAKAARQMLDEGKSADEIILYMQNEMWISSEKAHLALEVSKKEQKIISDMRPRGISLYIGVPFCPTRCAYCSFVSQAIDFNRKFVEPYADALLIEMKTCSEIIKKIGLEIETVYIGGGTPTSVPLTILRKILKGIRENFDLSYCREFTVEAGRPDTFSEEMLLVLSEYGVNRLSINPQTMHQATLDLIGRKHTVEDTVRAFEMVKKVGKFSINADLIAGLPGENMEIFCKSLDRVISLSPDAITVHTMYMKRAAQMIEEFEKYRFTNMTAEMMSYASNLLIKSGFLPYYMYKQKNTLGNLENVGFCKEGSECIYNIYIMEEVQSVMALGGGASSKVVADGKIKRIYNPKDAADYIRRIEEITKKKELFAELLLGGENNN